MVPQAWAPIVVSGAGQAVCKVSSYYSSCFPRSQEQSSKLSQGIPRMCLGTSSMVGPGHHSLNLGPSSNSLPASDFILFIAHLLLDVNSMGEEQFSLIFLVG